MSSADLGEADIMVDKPRVAVVTGGSRGAGRGIAIALGERGYTVYVTGRTEKAGQATLEGTIHDTAARVTASGGTGIAVRVDHRDDAEVEALFERVADEAGNLDILVNNAALLHEELLKDVPFWQKSLATSADLLDVGLRSGLVAAYYAAPLLIAGGRGLIVFTSAPGAVHYQYGPGYGAQKAGMDKMATDMGVDFEPYGVAVVSIWMGAVLTERLQRIIDSGPEMAYLEDIAESPEFTGRVIAALYDDPNLMDKTGRTLIGAEEARQYSITDRGGRQPPSFRDLMKVEPANYRGRPQR
jgi:NAD(P)-dependent dehydrogenase (short-subunit alcohol dehydrogenase family)